MMTAIMETLPRAGSNTPVDPVEVRKTMLGILHRGKASHLGTSMSLVELLIAIYGSVDCEKIRVNAPDRPRVVISKGHGAAATYTVMAYYGLISPETLNTYHQEGSLLTGLVNHEVGGVEHSTGGLGHGLSIAVGAALGLRARGKGSVPVICVVGDGEIQEGSIWEAVMLAQHLKLSNLVIVVDNNRLGSITRTDQVIDLSPIAQRFAGFDLATRTVDGHDVDAIRTAIGELLGGSGPGVVVCDTVKGKGVPFAEWQPIWHYRSLNDETYQQAMDVLEGKTV